MKRSAGARPEGEWAIVEVVAHLADTEERTLDRTRRMLGEEEPFLEPYDPDALALERAYLGMDIAAELDRFEALRAEQASLLAGLGDRGLAAVRRAWRAWTDHGPTARGPHGRRGRGSLRPDRSDDPRLGLGGAGPEAGPPAALAACRHRAGHRGIGLGDQPGDRVEVVRRSSRAGTSGPSGDPRSRR